MVLSINKYTGQLQKDSYYDFRTLLVATYIEACRLS
jgi:hypothetical protein